MNKWVRALVFLYIIGVGFIASSQVLLKGQVLDSLSQPVTSATILLYTSKDSKSFDDFKITNTQGKFTFESPTNFEFPIKLKIIHLSHEDLWFNATTLNPTILLKDRKTDLKPVTIKAEKPLTIKGDTLSYAVSQWKVNRDTSIEDVIERIPGVEVSDNGIIRYNGKSIRHLYINGLDLLENRYSIATRGLSADDIKNIEVLKNHNHKKNERDLDRNRDVSMNLETKESTLFSARSTLKGATPIPNGRINSTPILISPKRQFAGSFNGATYDRDHVFDDRNVIDVNTLFDPKPSYTPIDLLPERRQQQTSINKRYWRDAFSGNLSLDVLQKTSKENQFKLGYSMDFDEVLLNQRFEETIALQNDTIRNIEVNNLLNISRNQYIKANYEINNDRNYGKLHLYARSSNDDQYASTIQNRERFDRRLRKDGQTAFLAWQESVRNGKKLWSYDTSLQYTRSRDELFITPEVFDVTNMGNSLFTQQDIAADELNIKAQGHFFKEFKRAKIEIIPGYKGDFQRIDSDLNQSGDLGFSTFPFQSDHNYRANRLMVNTIGKYNYNRWSLTLENNLYYNNILSESNNNDTDKLSGVYSEPKLTIAYKLNQKWKIDYYGTLTNDFTDLNSFQAAFIVRDYNSSSNFQNRIGQSRDLSNFLSFKYTDVFKSLFARTYFSYNRVTNTLISELGFDERGFRSINFREQDNVYEILSANVVVRKTIATNLNASLKGSYSRTVSDVFINGLEDQIESSSYRGNLSIDYDPGNWYFLEGKLDVSVNESGTSENLVQSNSISYNLSFSQVWNDKSYSQIKWNGQRNEILNNVNTNNLLDIKYVYKFENSREFSVELRNILHQKDFESISVDANITSVNSFPLLGRQLILSYSFSF